MKPFLSFISGLFIPAVLYTIGGYLLLAMTFTLS
jgi:hypothetical protein